MNRAMEIRVGLTVITALASIALSPRKVRVNAISPGITTARASVSVVVNEPGIAALLDPEDSLPAIGQGALARHLGDRHDGR